MEPMNFTAVSKTMKLISFCIFLSPVKSTSSHFVTMLADQIMLTGEKKETEKTCHFDVKISVKIYLRS